MTNTALDRCRSALTDATNALTEAIDERESADIKDLHELRRLDRRLDEATRILDDAMDAEKSEWAV